MTGSGAPQEAATTEQPLMTIRIDRVANAAYIRVPHARAGSPVARTITDVECNIDLAENGLVIGVEVLGWPDEFKAPAVPVEQVNTDYHFHSGYPCDDADEPKQVAANVCRHCSQRIFRTTASGKPAWAHMDSDLLVCFQSQQFAEPAVVEPPEPLTDENNRFVGAQQWPVRAPAGGDDETGPLAQPRDHESVGEYLARRGAPVGLEPETAATLPEREGAIIRGIDERGRWFVLVRQHDKRPWDEKGEEGWAFVASGQTSVPYLPHWFDSDTRFEVLFDPSVPLPVVPEPSAAPAPTVRVLANANGGNADAPLVSGNEAATDDTGIQRWHQGHMNPDGRFVLYVDHVKSLAGVRADERAKVIEECAQAAEAQRFPGVDYYNDAIRDAAKAIRSLSVPLSGDAPTAKDGQ